MGENLAKVQKHYSAAQVVKVQCNEETFCCCLVLGSAPIPPPPFPPSHKPSSTIDPPPPISWSLLFLLMAEVVGGVGAKAKYYGKTTFDGGSLRFIFAYLVIFNHATSRLMFT